MVLAEAAEARRQRILLKRERAKQENNETIIKEEGSNQTITAQQNEEVKLEKKPKLEVSENITTNSAARSDDDNKDEDHKPQLAIPNSRDIVANVYRFLEQEYKFMQINNMDICNVRPLAAIGSRTAAATGLSKDLVKKIVREDRARMRSNRRRNNPRDYV